MLETLRKNSRNAFPNLTFYFQPADIVSQILNFGLPAPIDIQIAGYADKPNFAIAREIEARMKQIPGRRRCRTSPGDERAGTARKGRSHASRRNSASPSATSQTVC